MSLLQGVLRSHAADSSTIERKLKSMEISQRSPPTTSDKDDSDDDLVNVVSLTLYYSHNTQLMNHLLRYLFQEPLPVLVHHRQLAGLPRGPSVAHYTSRHHEETLSRRYPQKFLSGYLPVSQLET